MLNKSFSIFIVTLLLFIAGTYESFAQKSNKNKIVIDTVRVDHSKDKAPVVPFQDTLFYVYGNIGSVSVKQRALNIEENVKKLRKDHSFAPDSMKIEIDGGNYLITYQGKTILGINDREAKVLGKSKEEISHEYLSIISDAIKKEQERHGWKNILKQIALSILIIVATYYIIKYINIGCRRLIVFVKKHENKAIEKIKFIIDEKKQITIVVFLIKTLRLILVLLVLYSCLFTFFRLFPETKWLSDTLIEYISYPLKTAFKAVVDFIPNLFYITIIFLLFRFFIKAIRVIAERVDDESIAVKGFYSDWALPTFNIVKIILYIFMFILIFPHLPGADSKAFQGVSVFLGVLFSLGSTSIIANIVSGIVITYMRPFKLGDRIRMGEFLGNVIEKTPLVTRIKTPKNEIITIPNGTIMSAQTVNYTVSAEEFGLILHTTIAVDYDISWRKIHELLNEAALATPDVLDDPQPFVLQTALDDFYVKYQINVYTKKANEMANIYSNLNKNIQDIFNREEIELLSPHYSAHRDGSKIMIPKESIQSGIFRTSPFNMKVQVSKDENFSKDEL